MSVPSAPSKKRHTRNVHDADVDSVSNAIAETDLTPRPKMRRQIFADALLDEEHEMMSAAKTSLVVTSRRSIFGSASTKDNEHPQYVVPFVFAMPGSLSSSPGKGGAAALGGIMPLMEDSVPVPKIVKNVRVSQPGDVNPVCLGFFKPSPIVAAYHNLGIKFPACLHRELNDAKEARKQKEAMAELAKLIAEAEASGHVRQTQHGEVEECEGV